MHATWLSPQVHAALDDADLVLLDVARDSYFCLPRAGEGMSIACGTRTLPGLQPELIEDLVEAGLASGTPPDTGPGRVAVAARRDLTDRPWPRTSLAEVGGLTASLFAMLRFYRGRKFQALVAHASARRLDKFHGSNPSAVVERRALAFQVLLPCSPVQGACLFQAFLLLDYLHRMGLTADWVFGVKTWPFSAHCWLQSGDLVLNDTVERVSGYRPILVV